MGLLREIFGEGDPEVWQQLSREIGAEFVDHGFTRGCTVEARYKAWTITLDTKTYGGEDRTTYTRMRAPYLNADGFWFKIHRRGPLSSLGKLFKRMEVDVGDAELDRDFVFQGNDAQKVAYLFRSPRIRNLIMAQPDIKFEGGYSPGVHESIGVLSFSMEGVIRDIPRLKQLFALFTETLNHLHHIGSAHDQDPGLTLEH